MPDPNLLSVSDFFWSVCIHLLLKVSYVWYLNLHLLTLGVHLKYQLATNQEKQTGQHRKTEQINILQSYPIYCHLIWCYNSNIPI